MRMLQRSAGNTSVARATGDPQPAADGIEISPAELEEVAGAMDLPASDPRVRQAVVTAKIDELMRRSRAPKPSEVPGADAPSDGPSSPQTATTTPAASAKEDPADPHTWHKREDETMEQFLERQRKGLLAKEVAASGLSEPEFRDQVLHKGTRTETHVLIGTHECTVIHEAIPSPEGTRLVTTIDIKTGSHIHRTRVGKILGGEQAFYESEIDGDKETVIAQRGDPKLIEGSPQKSRPHRRWTKLPDGRVKSESLDAWGAPIPGSETIVDVLQSPQDRIKAEQARDPNAVWTPSQ